jgi:plastocyanin
MTRGLLVAVLALLAGSASFGAVSESRKPAAHTVVIEAMQFKPATLSVRPGDSVTWINKDIVAHTATSPAAAKVPFDSQMIAVGREWKHTFTRAGTYDYICTYHPTMKAVVEVTAQGSASRTRGR